MIKVEILEALPKLSAEERREIRAKLNELDNEACPDDGEISEREKAIIEARLDEYDQNPETGSSWEEAKARVLAGLHAK
jgi:putative addiction module component (TIGR02574 family)